MRTTVTLDNDVPGFAVSQTNNSTEVSEAGNTDSISVVLTSQPTSDVTISIRNTNPNATSVGPETLVFTSAKWNEPQSVLVSAVNNNVVDGDRPAGLILSIVDPASAESFRDVPDQTVGVKVIDDDTAEVSVAAASG